MLGASSAPNTAKRRSECIAQDLCARDCARDLARELVRRRAGARGLPRGGARPHTAAVPGAPTSTMSGLSEALGNVVLYVVTLLLPAAVLWVVSGRSLADFISFGSSLGKRVKEDTTDIDTEILASCIQDLRMGNDLSLAYRQVARIPLCIVHSSGAESITKVDLTECGIRDLSNLSYFPSLELLVLDKNRLDGISTCPKLARLHTLWCNNNRITDLGNFLKEVAIKFPNIYHLSMMRNPATPETVIWSDGIDYANETSEDMNRRIKYHKYRLAVLSVLPQIRILDDESVTPEEHAEAQELGDSIDFFEEDVPLCRDETETWKWPDGYDPPAEWLRNPDKVEMIRSVQTQLDACGEDFRALAADSMWDVNKRTVSRYLEASLWKPCLNGVPVATAILESVRWRRLYPIPIKDRALLHQGLSKGSFIVTGESKDKWPILYVLFHNDKLSDPAVNAKCLLYSFERAIQSMPPQKQEFVLVIDTKGFGYANVPPMHIVSEMSEILAKHMPRRLGVVFVVNVSYVVHWVYDMVSIAMSEVTRNKFRFISSNKDDMRRIMGQLKNPSLVSSHAFILLPC